MDFSASRPVLVTGASGTIGHHVVTDLLAAGTHVRSAGRDARAATGTGSDRVAPVRFDFTDPTTWSGAFRGVEVMFLMRPPLLSNIARDMAPALAAAKSAGVRHVVLLSLQGAETNRVVPHARLEEWLRSSGLTWTFVRPSFFMENLTGAHVRDIRDRDAILVPAGAGATSFVAASDVAAVAVAALLDPAAHTEVAWTPTGPQALTYDEVAAILSAELGRPITYRHPGVLRYLVHARRTLGMPLPLVGITTAIYTLARLGRAAGLTDDVAAVTGRPPVGLAQWAHDHREAWRRDA